MLLSCELENSFWNRINRLISNSLRLPEYDTRFTPLLVLKNTVFTVGKKRHRNHRAWIRVWCGLRLGLCLANADQNDPPVAANPLSPTANATIFYKSEMDDGLKVAVIFKNGLPVSASLLDWGSLGVNLLDHPAYLTNYKNDIHLIRVAYNSPDQFVNFYFDYANQDCLGFSGLMISGPDYVPFQKIRRTLTPEVLLHPLAKRF